MAEQQISGTDAAELIGMDQRAFSRRYRGRVEWSLNELSLLATRVLDVDFGALVQHRPVGPDLVETGAATSVRHEGLEPPTRWFRATPARRLRLTARAVDVIFADLVADVQGESPAGDRGEWPRVPEQRPAPAPAPAPRPARSRRLDLSQRAVDRLFPEIVEPMAVRP